PRLDAPSPTTGALAPTRLPGWPGPVFTIVGFALAMSAFVTGELARVDLVRAEARPVLLALGILGALMLAGGLVYTLVRQLRRRRVLPPDRYRGPSIVLLLAFGILLAAAATLPVAADVTAIFLGEGQATLAGAIVIISSTQVALLIVSWVFVLRPRAVAFAMPLLGSERLRALRVGVGWGILAWIGASAATYAMVLLLEGLGVEPDVQPAEVAIGFLEPWLVVVAVVIVAPIAEEVFFRGLLFGALAKKGLPQIWVLVISSAVFALIHLEPVRIILLFGIGLVLGLARWLTRSTTTAIVAHVVNNSVSSIGLIFLLFQ
ncbi:MAG: type II CAAX endopeptidase family protein, partial [Candidatus Nanopelagicales bacterium]|nr:type II CAAX endopeptidase family protein [Candidatus Nanopelagicales bacterium]